MSLLKFGKLGILLGGMIVTSPAFSLDGASFTRSPNGVTFQGSKQTLLVQVCSDSVFHVVASPTKNIPESIVPTVTRPCIGASFKLSSSAAMISIKTPLVTVNVDRASLTVQFLNARGERVLAEKSEGGRSRSPQMKLYTDWVSTRRDSSMRATSLSNSCRPTRI
jgi:hypothetical protein